MAGMSVSGSREWVSSPLAARGFPATVDVASDLLAIFSSGTWQRDGYAMVAGTGAAGIRVHDGRVERTADGLGWLLGDVGSGYWIGHRVVTAAIASLDGRGEETELVPLVLHAVGIDNARERGVDGRPLSLRDLVEKLYQLRPIELSRFAPLAFQATTDAVARAILDDAVSALAGLFFAMAAADLTGPLVLGGSVLTAQPVIHDRVIATLRAEGFTPEVRHAPDGVVGAAVLTLRQAGVEVDSDVFDRIGTSLARLR